MAMDAASCQEHGDRCLFGVRLSVVTLALLALGAGEALLAAGANAASEPVPLVVDSCTETVTGAADRPVTLRQAAVMNSVAEAIRVVPEHGPAAAKLVSEAMRHAPPLALGEVPDAGSRTISGKDIADRVAAEVATIRGLDITTEVLDGRVHAALDSQCGVTLTAVDTVITNTAPPSASTTPHIPTSPDIPTSPPIAASPPTHTTSTTTTTTTTGSVPLIVITEPPSPAQISTTRSANAVADHPSVIAAPAPRPVLPHSAAPEAAMRAAPTQPRSAPGTHTGLQLRSGPVPPAPVETPAPETPPSSDGTFIAGPATTLPERGMPPGQVWIALAVVGSGVYAAVKMRAWARKS